MKTISLIALLFCSHNMLSQISLPAKNNETVTVGKIAPLSSFLAELNYQIVAGDTMYTLVFQDARYTKITSYESITFSGKDSTVEKLYDVFQSFFSDPIKEDKDYKLSFLLGNESITLSNYRAFGGNSIRVIKSNGGNITFSEKQIKKLFNRK